MNPDVRNVKSAARVLEVFEYFARIQTSASVKEVSEALGYPQSSTSVLLKSLYCLGYLHYNPTSRTYQPTLRFALTGWWIRDGYLSGDSITSLMIDVRNRTGFGVSLGIQKDIWAQCIQRIPPLGQQVWKEKFGLSALRPLCESAAGKIFLSLQPDERVALIVRRMNAEMTDEPPVDVAQMMEEIGQVRRTGFAYAKDTRFGNGSIATLLSEPGSELPMTIAVAGRTAEIQSQAEFIKTELRAAINEARANWTEQGQQKWLSPNFGTPSLDALKASAEQRY